MSDRQQAEYDAYCADHERHMYQDQASDTLRDLIQQLGLADVIAIVRESTPDAVLAIAAIERALAIAAAVDAEPVRPEVHVGEDFDGEPETAVICCARYANALLARLRAAGEG